MGKKKISGKELLALGYPQSDVIGIALNIVERVLKKENKVQKLQILAQVLKSPEKFEDDEHLGMLAKKLLEKRKNEHELELREQLLAYPVYGEEHIDFGARRQMDVAVRLPISVAAALMPDAHVGYGLPIGGVLATENAVIPFGVGVDIGCRMCLSVFDLPADYLRRYTANLKEALLKNTAFGAGNSVDKPMDDPIFEREEFRSIKVAKHLFSKASKQIGSSGSGNHFVEWGLVKLTDPTNEFSLPPGTYLGLLSHSGSRALGAGIANHYTHLAMKQCRLPKEAKHLAWLDMDTEAGQEYWLAMNLAGDYASACHHHIHERMAKFLKEKPVARVENHHNFAWKERMADGREVIVHRKGATPAAKGELGIIPGSMVLPGYIVRGRGQLNALNSAAHGAGRLMSRRQASEAFTKKEVAELLESHGVTLIGGGLDEAPGAYKDIHEVMRAQQELVDVLGTFTPKVVRMDQ